MTNPTATPEQLELLDRLSLDELKQHAGVLAQNVKALEDALERLLALIDAGDERCTVEGIRGVLFNLHAQSVKFTSTPPPGFESIVPEAEA